MLLTSCQFFDKKVPDKEVMLKEELGKINWEEVDEFPTSNNCDSIIDKELQKKCFFNYIVENIYQRINTDTLKQMYPNLDTISVKVTIHPNATLNFKVQQPKDTVRHDLRIVDSILQKNLSNFPHIEPAIKRGIKVKTQFILPIVVKSKE
ncbi:conserved hypothetical protein [Flavobacterium sp. 9AF]|nr:conserved hypothetical protein [Flavobacterium sp. 9AF]